MFNLSKGGIFDKPSKSPIQLKNIKVEDFPIYTMKKDLERVKDPNFLSNANESVPESSPRPPFSQDEKLAKFMGKDPDAAKKSTSPFLSQENKKLTSSLPTPPMKETAVDPASGAAFSVITPNSTSHHIWARVVMIAIVIFALLATGFGGYYFWVTKQPGQTSSPNPSSAISPTPAPEKNAPSTQPSSSFSQDKPNYLSIDTENITSGQIKTLIDQHASDILAAQISSPIEFILTDKQNNPLNFDQFAAKAGITLTPDILANLSNNFSLFMYNDNSKIKIGLAVDSKDATGEKLKSALLKDESALAQGLGVLYISSTPSTDGKPFNTSYYGGAEIRYLNLVSSDEASLDYTIFRDKLLIGTSKMTLRSIIDYETANSGTENTQNTAQ